MYGKRTIIGKGPSVAKVLKTLFLFSLVLENLKADFAREVQTFMKSSDLQAPPFVAYLAKKSKSSSGPGTFF